jgi:beta-lactamase class D
MKAVIRLSTLLHIFAVIVLPLVGIQPPAYAAKSTSQSTRKPVATKRATSAKPLTATRKSSVSKKSLARQRPTVRKAHKPSARTKRTTAKRPIRKAKYTRYRGPSYIARGPWLAPNFVEHTFEGDQIDGEDLDARRAAVAALGNFNGTVVVTEARTGRILTMVNRRLALSGGFQPCSMVKLYAAAAGIAEGIVDGSKPVALSRRSSMDMTFALAKSNNPYFSKLGVDLGYETFARHGRLLGLGEKAGWQISGEQPGAILDSPPPASLGGMGMMTSFGEGIRLTPLQAAATLGAFANGGDLLYLQHPRSNEPVEPRLKRKLDLTRVAAEMRDGMNGATLYGTAARAGALAPEPLLGKTGTCTDRNSPTHLGWFGAYTRNAERPLVIVVMLTGGRAVNGPVASEIAGRFFRNLSGQADPEVAEPAAALRSVGDN